MERLNYINTNIYSNDVLIILIQIYTVSSVLIILIQIYTVTT